MVQGIALEEAIRLINAHVSLLPVKYVSLYEAHGCILAQDVASIMEQPPFSRSPLDGYAIRSEDIQQASREHPVYLEVVDCVYAGEEAKRTIAAGEAVRVTTGAMLPEGCDGVIRQEDTDYGKTTVAVYQSIKAYENYCFIGEEYHTGEQILQKGAYLDAAALAVLSGAGIFDEIPVYAMPSVAIVCTGSEIVPPDAKLLPPGKIYSINGTYLAARLSELGVAKTALYYAADDVDEMAAMLSQLTERHDLLITTGGVSVGEKDLLQAVLAKMGAQQIFWRVLLKPGTPAMFAVKDGKAILSLSGNPFAAAATFELLARPLIAAVSGNVAIIPVAARGTLQNGFTKPSHGRRFIRATYADGQVWIPQSHASAMMQSFCGCNCLIDIPAGSGPLHAGMQVNVVLL